jgi:amino acid adenylation domain-containing protein
MSRSTEAAFVPELFHNRAIENPAAIAVADTNRSFNYRQLNERANHLARQLRELGVGPEVVVGLLANRSPEMILGALAILRAGGAYLPLDAAYPTERLSFILADARCRLLLAGPGLEPPGSVEHLVPIELEGPTTATAPASEISGDQLAYVIYTSGSSGRPKGVEITHAALLNLLQWHQRTFAVTAADRATQIAAVGFDAAVWEVWPYLTAGASLHLPPEVIRSEPGALRDWLLAQRITISFVPTPMAERLLSLPWSPHAALRFLLTGGDTLHVHPPAGLPFVLVNNYGPTENTVVATSGAIHPYGTEQRPTIGRPIDNVQIRVLDQELREVPPGSPGELHLGGAGVARGYLHQPELTRARFIDDPFSPGARLYKTGDLVRQLPDGQLAFLGRSDDQLKVRGFRIEPGEIVYALDQQPGITASAVVASDLGGGEKRLTAYLVLAPGARPGVRALQEALGARLPDYMVPGVFVALDALPLGPHGKLDRRALPEPTPANTLRDGVVEEPRSEVERAVARMVCALLGVEAVGLTDNFFLLGGHSLMGTQLIARIRAAFAVELALRTIFEAPTVAELAQEVERLLLEKLATLSDEETRRLLEQKSAG